jgi:uncharacterized protein (TIGR02452 family)
MDTQTYEATKQWRVNIHKMISTDFMNGYYTYESKRIDIPSTLVESCINHTVKYSLNELNILFDLQKFKQFEDGAKIRVRKLECMDLALYYKNEGFNPVLLNMASASKPGGGYKSGAGAQEESLFRRTCLHLCLQDKFYPLEPTSGLYTPNVCVIANNENQKYAYYDNPRTMNIISMAAYNNNFTNKVKFELSDQQIQLLTYEKIDTIFKMAIVNSHDVIILSAFGCGAFKNNPETVATIFKYVIKTNNYDKYFKHIIFAIIDDYNAKVHGGNYKIFKDILES